ncbi:MAG: hypothetical protein ACP6IS_05630 [Candidatus Asgardarchaeia archaeon]
MNYPEIVNKHFKGKNFILKVSVIFLKNGIIFLATDSDFIIGNLAIAFPSKDVQSITTHIPFPVLSREEDYLSEIITEKIANIARLPTIAIINFKSKEQEKVLACINLFKQILAEKEES